MSGAEDSPDSALADSKAVCGAQEESGRWRVIQKHCFLLEAALATLQWRRPCAKRCCTQFDNMYLLSELLLRLQGVSFPALDTCTLHG